MAVTAAGPTWGQQRHNIRQVLPPFRTFCLLGVGDLGRDGDWECQTKAPPRIPGMWIGDPPLEVSVGPSRTVLFGVLGFSRSVLLRGWGSPGMSSLGFWSFSGVPSLGFWSSPGVWGFGEQLLHGWPGSEERSALGFPGSPP